MARGLSLVIGVLPKVCNWVMGVTGISEKIRIEYEPSLLYQPSPKEELARFKLNEIVDCAASWLPLYS